MNRPIALMQLFLLVLGWATIMSATRGQTPPGSAEPLAAEQTYQKTVGPFFSTYCTKCHAGKNPSATFRIDAETLPNDFASALTREKWHTVVEVLNSHEMPPEEERQPSADEVAQIVDWITQQTVAAELQARDGAIFLRRLNREEYHHTIRDLLNVDFDISGFPQDPPAGGFDNNGSALTIAPLHLEMYLTAARQILDRALVEGDRPGSIKWHLEPQPGPGDRIRVQLDDQNRHVIVNGGENQAQGDWVRVHHNAWNKHVSSRNFAVPMPGTYIIRIRAAGIVPNREQVVQSADILLQRRAAERMQREPKQSKWIEQERERDLQHFRTDRMYDYGPPRIKLVLQLGPQPRTIAEFDVPGTLEEPTIQEIPARFTTESAGVTFEYAYSIPSVLENFWMQRNEDFARPELLIDWFEIEGPIYDSWPPPSHTAILFDDPATQTDENASIRQVLAQFMNRAYRRPVTPAEVEAKWQHYTAARQEGLSLIQALKRPLLAILLSPHFLYLVEPAGDCRPLNDYELASRLSYFLWSSMPDETLFQLAAQGKLRDAQVRQQQVQRMLQDKKSAAFVTNFAGQWLGLREVGNNPPAEDLFPRYDRHLEVSIVRESEAFFREILDKDLPATTLVKSSFVTINERLARFYGIAGVKGDEFRRVPVPAGAQRGGIPTQASILTITSNGTRTSPVKRGTWILKTLLGIDPGLPVANAGEIAPKVPGIDKATVRQRLEIHRSLPQCARCHNKIDPLGFALENFNAAGEWRDREGFGYKGRINDNDPLIDASSKMIDGTPIVGVAGLQDAILEQEDRFLECLCAKILTYALGRELGVADRPIIRAAVHHMKQNGTTIRSLIEFVVTSEPFGTK